MALQYLLNVFILIVNVFAQTNLVINGDFSLPIILPPDQNINYLLDWNGT